MSAITTVVLPHLASELGEVNPMVVIEAKRGVALGTLSLSRLIACPNAVIAEDMEALCQHRVLLPRSTAGAVELALMERVERR